MLKLAAGLESEVVVPGPEDSAALAEGDAVPALDLGSAELQRRRPGLAAAVDAAVGQLIEPVVDSAIVVDPSVPVDLECSPVLVPRAAA